MPVLTIVASLTSYKLNGEKTIITKYTQFSNVTKVGGLCSNSAQDQNPAEAQRDPTLTLQCHHIDMTVVQPCDPFSIFGLRCECGQSIGQFSVSLLKHYHQISNVSYKNLNFEIVLHLRSIT